MLNVDKYREELLKEIETREIESDNENSSGLVYFDSIEAVKRKYGGGSSPYFSDDVKWLFTEYEPPLLENGDNLNPGDWIMVRDFDDSAWYHRQFMCYYKGLFLTAYDDEGIVDTNTFIGWKQARLPMEGE